VGLTQNTYVVQPGDSLRYIADRFRLDVNRLEKLNGLEGDTLQPGQKLILRKEEPTPAPSPAAPAISAKPTPQTAQAKPKAFVFQRGIATWYGGRFHGRRTASGEAFNAYTLTAAHRTLPFGTRVRVTNLNNGRSVIVRINDRGPYTKGRILDMSRAAAQQIWMNGTALVTIEVLK
jgi:rare lipoprotein A